MHRHYYHLLVALGAALLFLTSSGKKPEQPKTSQPVRIIFETDLDDIDDAIAMDILHKYIDMGKAEVLAVNVNKKGLSPA